MIQSRIKLMAVIVAAILTAATVIAIVRWSTGAGKTTVVAYFPSSNGIYAGDDVRILGVRVGSIDKIEPQPLAAKVTFSFDSKYPVPADVKAAVLSPSLVTARAIQLVPAYTGGPTLQSGAVIPRDRTAVPVEWDDFRVQLQKLTESLQPTTPSGPNSVGELVNTAADNLRGEGANVRDTLVKLSQATSALGDHSTDIFSTVRNVQALVSGLRSSSDLLADFNQNLASLTSALSNKPDEVATAARDLDGAVTDLRSFVADNRESLGTTFDHLNSITTAVNDSRNDLTELLHSGPSIFSNFSNIYQPAQGAFTGYLALANFANPVQFICGAIQSAARIGAAASAKLCAQYLAPIIKNRQYNFPPLGLNPLVGVAARPNEVTYSENRLNPNLPPPPPATAPADPGAAPQGVLPPPLTPTDPARGLSGMMIPGRTP